MNIVRIYRAFTDRVKCLPFGVLIAVILLLSLIPAVEVFSVLGDRWQGFFPSFGDENFYYAHVQTIAEGYYNDGNPYFFEHRFDPPLVLFGGAWLNALPLLLGIPFNAAVVINFILWSLAFAAVAYLLYKELAVSPWLSVAGVVIVYLQSYQHVFRPANLQPVYPFYFLFYLALARFMREQTKTNILLLALVSASTCYLYSFLWQAVAVTLGLLILYTLAKRDWPLFKAALLSSTIGGLLGLPAVLYPFWLSHASPYFWESIARFGLVYTHIPMAEIVYSGGWVGVILAFLALLYWRAPALRGREFYRLCLFISISGLGLWITQGSNALTGMLVETGEHVRILIFPWVLFVDIMLGSYLWRRRADLSFLVRTLSVAVIVVVTLVSLQYTYNRFAPFVAITEYRRDLWDEQQRYVKLFDWLQTHESSPVVIWSEPSSSITIALPVFTRHFDLYTIPGIWELVSEEEIRERYLVSQYFNNPTKDDLKENISVFLGRQDVHHIAKTREREIKVCRLLSAIAGDRNCGEPKTSLEILGEGFFDQLVQKFQGDIKPNITTYLKKYHVSYILKDNTLNSDWHPEALKAKRVYSDGRYELYRLP